MKFYYSILNHIKTLYKNKAIRNYLIRPKYLQITLHKTSSQEEKEQIIKQIFYLKNTAKVKTSRLFYEKIWIIK